VDMVEPPRGQQAAIESLLKIAVRDTGQSRRVANFLLAWYNANGNGGWDPGDLWAIDAPIRQRHDYGVEPDPSLPASIRVGTTVARGQKTADDRAIAQQLLTRQTSLMTCDGVLVVYLADGPGGKRSRVAIGSPGAGATHSRP